VWCEVPGCEIEAMFILSFPTAASTSFTAYCEHHANEVATKAGIFWPSAERRKRHGSTANGAALRATAS
jgi:hypothetical protein